jgi:hypothetical protein
MLVQALAKIHQVQAYRRLSFASHLRKVQRQPQRKTLAQIPPEHWSKLTAREEEWNYERPPERDTGRGKLGHK